MLLARCVGEKHRCSLYRATKPTYRSSWNIYLCTMLVGMHATWPLGIQRPLHTNNSEFHCTVITNFRVRPWQVLRYRKNLDLFKFPLSAVLSTSLQFVNSPFLNVKGGLRSIRWLLYTYLARWVTEIKWCISGRNVYCCAMLNGKPSMSSWKIQRSHYTIKLHLPLLDYQIF